MKPNESDDIFSTDYWRGRLQRAVDQEMVHHAVYEAPPELWHAIADKHRSILSHLMVPSWSVLDVGCGWGRLLSLLPKWWRGDYCGVDLSPDFVEIARRARPDRDFLTGDVRDLDVLRNVRKSLGIGTTRRFDVAVMVSFRPMIVRCAGQETWDGILANLRTVADRMLYLEYNEKDEGSLE